MSEFMLEVGLKYTNTSA